MDGLGHVKKYTKIFKIWFFIMVLTLIIRKSCFQQEIFILGGQYYSLGQSTKQPTFQKLLVGKSVRPNKYKLINDWDNQSRYSKQNLPNLILTIIVKYFTFRPFDLMDICLSYREVTDLKPNPLLLMVQYRGFIKRFFELKEVLNKKGHYSLEHV